MCHRNSVTVLKKLKQSLTCNKGKKTPSLSPRQRILVLINSRLFSLNEKFSVSLHDWCRSIKTIYHHHYCHCILFTLSCTLPARISLNKSSTKVFEPILCYCLESLPRNWLNCQSDWRVLHRVKSAERSPNSALREHGSRVRQPRTETRPPRGSARKKMPDVRQSLTNRLKNLPLRLRMLFIALVRSALNEQWLHFNR